MKGEVSAGCKRILATFPICPNWLWRGHPVRRPGHTQGKQQTKEPLNFVPFFLYTCLLQIIQIRTFGGAQYISRLSCCWAEKFLPYQRASAPLEVKFEFSSAGMKFSVFDKSCWLCRGGEGGKPNSCLPQILSPYSSNLAFANIAVN